MIGLVSTIFLVLVGAFTLRGGGSWVTARDRWALITAFVTALAAFALVSLPLATLVIPAPVWHVGVGLLAGGVAGATLRWPELPWYASTMPRLRALGISATLAIGSLLIAVALV